MEIGRGMAALFAVVAVLSSSVAAARPCFDACCDQCVPRDEFWFCQLSCYHRCGGQGGLGCGERSCVLSLCGQLRPGSKMMAACRDTCRHSYASAACTDVV
ncbi:hypothetical protein QOZ80_1BG0072990 [Eleusine coracana subsp. coracana]|nr:hypothetical protein QOZ80_1BG0072990 [Eleusine coracana subsp. coracana]